ncbi:MAG: ABC transporter ATP-binding protein [Bacteroidetes bacterium]|nr:ABC transporter ATP-binding protein [Bacteroidota bacterium]
MLEIQNVSKKFRIQHEKQSYLSLRDSLTSIFKSNTSTSEDFYALKNINFEVFPGESIGIIGRNGAGKSTLLKILSKITPPSSGKIISRGRIASLLEVGTGFHSELSGRENIFLNGSILGMKRKEIQAKFDEIVDFSGTEKFLDTPLKHYSSGMQLRLAFAVAAFLEPEILIIDEVLAVGDAEFQKKCLGKMEDVSRNEGRTLLFVSHNLASVAHLCSKGILLNAGEIAFTGLSQAAIDTYSRLSQNSGITSVFKKPNPEGKTVELIAAALLDKEGKSKEQFEIDEEITLSFTLNCNEKLPNTFGYVIVKSRQEEVFIETDTTDFLPNIFESIVNGTSSFKLKIKPHVLPHGEYLVYLSITSSFAVNFVVDQPGDILSFTVLDSKTQRAHRRNAKTSQILKWELQHANK